MGTGTNPSSNPPTPGGSAVPAQLGGYDISAEVLGKGAMGAIYAARHQRLRRPAAVKVMLSEYATNAVARERFVREGIAAAQVNHPNVVTIYDADEQGGVPFIAMERLVGESLEERLAQGSLSVEEVLQVGIQLADGLAAAHKSNVIHRDIKPSNIFLLDDPLRHVKILDFGIARFRAGESLVELTKAGVVFGTPHYMSPEQALGSGTITASSDLFSLGAVLFRITTGQLPFPGTAALEVLVAVVSSKPAALSREQRLGIPPELLALIYRLLEKAPADRPASAAAVATALRAIDASCSAPPPPPPPIPVTDDSSARKSPEQGTGKKTKPPTRKPVAEPKRPRLDFTLDPPTEP